MKEYTAIVYFYLTLFIFTHDEIPAFISTIL